MKPKKSTQLTFLLLALGISVGYAQAPNISYPTPDTYTVNAAITPLTPTNTGGDVPSFKTPPIVLGSGFNDPRGMALDASGNIYFADNGDNVVKEIPAGGGTAAVIGSGFSTPTDVAIDAVGNVYVADYGNHVVKKVSAGGGAITIIGSGFSGPYGLALDASGNLFVTDLTLNTLFEIAAGTGATTTVATGFKSPRGLAVDASGNLFIANTGTKKILEVTPGSSTPIIVVGGFGNLVDVAVDGAGNLYAADGDDLFIEKIPAGTKRKVPVGVISQISGITVDAGMNVFTGNGAGPGNGTIKEFKYGEWKINKALPTGLAFDNATGIISGTPTAVSPATKYKITATNSDGSSEGTVKITVQAAPALLKNGRVAALRTDDVDGAPNISYPTPDTYTVNTAITPLTPTNSGGSVPDTYPVLLAPISYGPRGIARDVSGNLYIADNASNAVKEVAAGSGTAVSIGSGFNAPNGVAVDAAGDIYVTDTGNGVVKEILAGTGTIITVGSGFTEPYGVALDASGSIYVSDVSQNVIKKIAPGGVITTTYATGFNAPHGLCIDASGNLFVANTGSKNLVEVAAGANTPTIINGGWHDIIDVAVAASGNLYVVAAGDLLSLYKVPAGKTSKIPVSKAVKLGGVTVDSKENVYVTASGDAMEVPFGGWKINKDLPAGLLIDINTGIISGTPTAVSAAANYKITGANGDGSSDFVVRIAVVSAAVPNISYQTPDTYTVNTAITPLTPTNTGGAVPGLNPVILASGFNDPRGLARDAAGDIYVADNGNNAVKEIAAGSSTPVTIGSGFNGPGAVALDAAGNIYVTDSGNGLVKEILAGSGTIITLGSGFTTPYGIALDAGGNIYVSDVSQNVVKEIAAGSGITTIYATGFNSPHGITLDGSGNLFVANTGNNKLMKVAPGGGAATIVNGGYDNIIDVAADASGNVFVAASLDLIGLYKVPAGKTSKVSVGRAVKPSGVAVDDEDNVYVGISGGNIAEVPFGGWKISALPAGLLFDEMTGIISGTPTAVTLPTNYIVTATNSAGVSKFTINIAVTATSGDMLLSAYAKTFVDSNAVADVIIHPGVTPNGDGQNDILKIENISAYPQNKVTIMNRNGAVVYEAIGYDNTSKFFDGHSSKTGALQIPGTYFYSLQYKAGDGIKTKTGFIVLKY